MIETLRWSREAGYDLLEEHLTRLDRSARQLGFPDSRDIVVQRLEKTAASLLDSQVRVRLVLSRSGTVEITSTPLLGVRAASWRVAIAETRHHAADHWLCHKTTMRDRYERPLAAAVAAVQADEVLFLNEQNQICEGARSNIFVQNGDLLLTPPLDCGVLPGTLRAHLIAIGKAREAILHLSDLAEASAWFMGNSVRGLTSATLVEA